MDTYTDEDIQNIKNRAYKQGFEAAKALHPSESAGVLPVDNEVSKWFEENIDKGCSASSAIYKFRLWLKELNVGAGVKGAVWVKASERLPGFETPVKWRLDGIERNKGKVTVVYMANGESPAFLSDYEWYDETGAPDQPGKEEAVKELVEFARDCAKNWDCDSDAHRYNTLCRKCEAQKLYDIYKNQNK